ncbi:12796_t:CDS:2 [Entrophospora sp. SA101]|nr:12796_t:CDS:2 [Entrophospora sp. SA101]
MDNNSQPSFIKREKEFMKLPEIQIVLPQRLKEKLIDDWATIMRDKILYHLPCSITVDEILVDYLNYKRGITSSTSGDNSLSSSTSSYSLSSKNASKSNDYTSSRYEDVHEEITNGIQAYFNTCLDTMLLYDEERVQNEDVHKTYPDKEWSEIYGAEHLLRLFVELPKLLVHTDLDEKAMDILKGHLADFLKFFEKNRSHYFVGMYEHDLSIPPNKKLKSSGKRAAKSYCTNCRTFNSPDWHAGETPDQILCSTLNPNSAARLQTEAQLLVANFWSNYDVLALLTDLNDYWEYFWLDGNDVCFWKIEERAKAVAILKDYVNVVGVNDIGRIGSEVGMSIDYPIGKRRKLDTNELVTVPSSDIANMEDFADEMSEIELKQWRVRCLMRKFFSMPYPQTVLAEVIEDDKFPSHIK